MSLRAGGEGSVLLHGQIIHHLGIGDTGLSVEVPLPGLLW